MWSRERSRYPWWSHGGLSRPSLHGTGPATCAAPVFLSIFIYTFMEVSKMPTERSLACSQIYWTATVLLVQNHSRLNVGKMKLPIGRPQTWMWTSITWEPIKMQIPIWRDREGLMPLIWGPHFPSQLNKHSLEASQVPGTVPSPRNTKIRRGPCLREAGVIGETA